LHQIQGEQLCIRSPVICDTHPGSSNIGEVSLKSMLAKAGPLTTLHRHSFSHSELASYLGSVFPLFSTAFTPVYGVLLDTVGRKWAMGIGALFYSELHWSFLAIIEIRS
jgi:MFS family permease